MPLFTPYKPKCADDVRPETRPIFQAIINSDVAAVKAALLVDDVNCTSAFRWTPLHVACRVYGNQAYQCINRPVAAEEIIKILVAAGALLDVRDSMGHHPAEFCEGRLQPEMAHLARLGTWPEFNPDSVYSDDETIPAYKPGRKKNFVPSQRVYKRPSRARAVAA
jgi:hypothetical protein